MTRAKRDGARALGLFSLLLLGINGIVGVGIFFVPQAVATYVQGLAGLWVYAAVLFGCIPVALVYAKLGQAFDEDGGPFVYAREAFGMGAAFGVGWSAYVSAVFSTSTVIVGLIESVHGAFGVETPSARAVAGALAATALAATLALGLRLSAWAWSTVTVAKLVPLFALAAVAVAGGLSATAENTAPLSTIARVPPAADWGHALGASLAVLFSLQGFEIVPLPAAQVRGSGRVVPIATVASLLLSGGLYLVLHAACVRALPDLGAHVEPLSDAARVLGGEGFFRLVHVGMVVSAFGIAVGMTAMTPRYLAALGRSDALGRRLGEQNARAVPVLAFVVTWALVVCVIVLSAFFGSMANLFALLSVAVILQYVVTALALGSLARKRHGSLAPRDAWPVPFSLVACAFIGFGAKLVEVAWVALLLGAGFGVRFAVQARAASRAKVAGELAP